MKTNRHNNWRSWILFIIYICHRKFQNVAWPLLGGRGGFNPEILKSLGRLDSGKKHEDVRQWWETTHPYIASPIQGRPKLDPPIFETHGKHPNNEETPRFGNPAQGFFQVQPTPCLRGNQILLSRPAEKSKRLVVGHQSSLEGSQGMSPKTNSGKTKCPKFYDQILGRLEGYSHQHLYIEFHHEFGTIVLVERQCQIIS